MVTDLNDEVRRLVESMALDKLLPREDAEAFEPVIREAMVVAMEACRETIVGRNTESEVIRYGTGPLGHKIQRLIDEIKK